MTKFSDVLAAGVTIRESANDGSDFTNPSADYRRLFLGEDGLLHVKDSAGTVTSPYSSGASGALVEVDYVQITSNASITATSEATANTVVTANALTGDGSTIYYIEFFAIAAVASNVAANRDLRIYLYDGSTSLGFIGYLVIPAAANDEKPIFLSRRLTPSAASHTYSIRASVSTGTGTITAGAGGTGANLPAYIRIVKRTP